MFALSIGFQNMQLNTHTLKIKKDDSLFPPPKIPITNEQTTILNPMNQSENQPLFITHVSKGTWKVFISYAIDPIIKKRYTNQISLANRLVKSSFVRFLFPLKKQMKWLLMGFGVYLYIYE